MVDSPTILRTEILNALSNIDIDKDDIEGIENYSRNRWYVVFHRTCTRSLAVGKTIELKEQTFTLQHPNPTRPRQNKYTTIRVYAYPLLFYGEVKSAHDIYDRICEVKTGAREVCMELEHQIPSFIFAGKYQVKITYWGQQRTCRKCHQAGHIPPKTARLAVHVKSVGRPTTRKPNAQNNDVTSVRGWDI